MKEGTAGHSFKNEPVSPDMLLQVDRETQVGDRNMRQLNLGRQSLSLCLIVKEEPIDDGYIV